MMEHTTDRLFWTLTSIIVGALILTLGINAFPKATQSTLQTFSGMTKQADTATTTASNAASAVLNNNDGIDGTNSGSTNDSSHTSSNGNNGTNNNNSNSNSSNNAQQTAEQADAAAKAAAQPYNPMAPATGVTFDSSKVGFNIIQDSNGNGILNGLYIPSDTTTITVPEYVVYKPNPWTPQQTIKIVGVDGQSGNVLTKSGQGNPISSLTTINLPSSLQYITGHSFDDQVASGPLPNGNVTINIPKSAQVQNYAFGMAGASNKETPNYY